MHYLRNLASAECRILSWVCPRCLWPLAYCSGLCYCNNITRNSSYIPKTTIFSFRKRHKMQPYLCPHATATISGHNRMRCGVFPILSIATVLMGFWMWWWWRQRTSNLLKPVQRRQWAAHAHTPAPDQRAAPDDAGWAVSIAGEKIKGTPE